MKIELKWQPSDYNEVRWQLNCGDTNCGEAHFEYDHDDDEWIADGNGLFTLDDAENFEYRKEPAIAVKRSIENSVTNFFESCFEGCNIHIYDKDLSKLLKTTPVPENNEEEEENESDD